MSNPLNRVKEKKVLVTVKNKSGDEIDKINIDWAHVDEFVSCATQFNDSLRLAGITPETHPDTYFVCRQSFPPMYGLTEITVFVPKRKNSLSIMITTGVKHLDTEHEKRLVQKAKRAHRRLRRTQR